MEIPIYTTPITVLNMMKIENVKYNAPEQQAFIAWAIATVITSSLCIASWTYHIDQGIRVISNAAYIISIPGWIPIYALGFSGVRDNPITIVIANGLAWLFWFMLIASILRVRSKLAKHEGTQKTHSQTDPGRRAFLGNAALGVTSIGALATPSYATLIEPWTIKVRKYTIPIKNLDSTFEGLKLVQLADTHLGPRIPESFIQQAVDLVIAQAPDLVLLTGDHIHDGTSEIDRAANLCKPFALHATIGAIGVLGNHDWWGDGPRITRALRHQGVHMIDNNRIWIEPKTRTIQSQDPGKGALAIVGFGDLTDDYIDTDRAFRDIAEATPRIVLSHNPDSAELSSVTKQGAPRIDLMCSGHTHGGQVKIPFLGTPIVPSRFGSKYAGGLVNGPAFPVHISRGIGMSMLPVRLGVPPEISVLTLTRA